MCTRELARESKQRAWCISRGEAGRAVVDMATITGRPESSAMVEADLARARIACPRWKYVAECASLWSIIAHHLLLRLDYVVYAEKRLHVVMRCTVGACAAASCIVGYAPCRSSSRACCLTRSSLSYIRNGIQGMPVARHLANVERVRLSSTPVAESSRGESRSSADSTCASCGVLSASACTDRNTAREVREIERAAAERSTERRVVQRMRPALRPTRVDRCAAVCR